MKQITCVGQAEKGFESLVNFRGMRFFQPDQDDSRAFVRLQGKQTRKIEVHRKDDSPFLEGFPKNSVVAGLRQADVPSMDRVMAAFPQPIRCPLVDRHVEKELHPRLSGRGGREGLLAGEPRGVFDSFVDVLKFQVRVALKNFLFRFSGRQQIEDQMDWNSHASNTRLAPQFVRLDRDPFEFSHSDFSIPQPKPTESTMGFLPLNFHGISGGVAGLIKQVNDEKPNELKRS